MLIYRINHQGALNAEVHARAFMSKCNEPKAWFNDPRSMNTNYLDYYQYYPDPNYIKKTQKIYRDRNSM